MGLKTIKQIPHLCILHMRFGNDFKMILMKVYLNASRCNLSLQRFVKVPDLSTVDIVCNGYRSTYKYRTILCVTDIEACIEFNKYLHSC